jgi:hypothetical protein
MTTSNTPYAELVKRLGAMPEFDDKLAVFINHWGLDAYDAPNDVIDCVRHIVAVARSAAIRSRSNATGEDKDGLTAPATGRSPISQEGSIAPEALSEGGE